MCVMWSTRLLVLGLVRWLGPVHGYLVRRELHSWRTPGAAEVGAGSVYHALKKLTADGLLEVVATESVDARPARTTYRVTVAGESEFQRMLREQLWQVASTEDSFHTAWSFASVLGKAENIALLRQRAEILYARIDALTVLLASTSAEIIEGQEANYLPSHVRALVKRQTDLMATDAEWCEQTAERIESGEMTFEPEPAGEGAERWREAIGSAHTNPVVEQWQQMFK